MDTLKIAPVDPVDSNLAVLIEAHLAHSWDATPETRNHTMTAADLVASGVVMVGAWASGVLLGCSGIRPLADGTGEVKSVDVSEAARAKGIAQAVMLDLAERAIAQGLSALVLETGS